MIESGQSSTNVIASRNSNSLDVKMKSRLGGDGSDLLAADEIDLMWGSDSKSQAKMLNRIRRIEKELQQLDLRNKENDFIIKNLK